MLLGVVSNHLVLTGSCLGLKVHQSHSDMIQSPNEKVHIFCTHIRADYRVMLWYLQPFGNTAMKLIGYLYFKDVTMEEPYAKLFNIRGDLGGNGPKNGSLSIQLEGGGQSGVYYCAASEAQQQK